MEHVHKTWTCDRCGETLSAKPDEDMRVTGVKHGEWAVEFEADWKHFCDRCRNSVTQFFMNRPTA